jgi:hypothetical protein
MLRDANIDKAEGWLASATQLSQICGNGNERARAAMRAGLVIPPPKAAPHRRSGGRRPALDRDARLAARRRSPAASRVSFVFAVVIRAATAEWVHRWIMIQGIVT